MFNRYKINQNRLNFLPSVFSLFIFGLFLVMIFWYFTPFQSSEIKVLALKEMVKSEQISGKFFGYLDYFEEPKSQLTSSISDPNPEITVKSFDSRVIDNQTFYLSQNCQNLVLKNCGLWSLDRAATLPKSLISRLDQTLKNNNQFQSFQNDNTFAKFAEKQDKNWLNIIIKTKNNPKIPKSDSKNLESEEIFTDSIGLLQIDKNKPQNSQFEILSSDNPKYLSYFR